jgi:predicted CXXCH cytochrome family protein
VCHSESFTQAKNEDCLACHKDIGKHAHNEKLHSSQLANINNKRCADCHRDHMGELALSNQNKLYAGAACETCHNDIKTQIPETTLRNVGDFSHNHPEFKVQMATLAKPLKMQRVILSNKTEAHEQTGLKFPHDIHVSEKGIKGPKGNEILKCDNCHRPDSAEIGFQEITMENHCQSCHELRFEPGLSNRQVPHGNVSDVLSTLREFYSYVAANPIPKAMQQHQEIIQIRPGDKNKTSAPLITNGDAKTRATLAAQEIFEKTACVVCHQISKTSNAGDRNTTGFDLPQYTVAAVTPSHPWMPQAKFNHQPHQQQACIDCHKANQSKKASDVLMPGIAVCKDCHVGKQAEANKIVSDCGLCHGFHSAANIKNKEFNQIHNDTSNAK